MKSKETNISWAATNEVASRSREEILPLYFCSHETPSVVLCSALGTPVEEGRGLVGVRTEEDHEDHRAGALFYEDRLRELKIFNQSKTRLPGSLPAC